LAFISAKAWLCDRQERPKSRATKSALVEAALDRFLTTISAIPRQWNNPPAEDLVAGFIENFEPGARPRPARKKIANPKFTAGQRDRRGPGIVRPIIGAYLRANSRHGIAMLHRICIFLAGVMVALSMFFVFRPHHPLGGIELPQGTLAATGCVDRPETSAIPAEYTCEKP
jgi:hypothetical protein